MKRLRWRTGVIGAAAVVAAASVGIAGARTAGTYSGESELLTSASPHLPLFDIAADGDRLFAVGAGGRVLRSDDGGATWTAERADTMTSLLGVSAAGDHVVAVGQMGELRVRSQDVEQTAAALAARGMRAASLSHDVVDEAQWMRAVDTAVQRFGGLDIVVNNAGIETMALFTECSVEDWDRTHDVNVKGVFLGIKHAMRAMRPGAAAGNGGVIINLSSVAGLIGMPALGAYCSSKGAVRLLTKAAAAEAAKLGYGIRVNSIHPAIVKTDMGANVVKGFARLGLAPDEASADAYIESLHPIGYGRPEDIASAVLFLASPASRWMTGTELVLDGGATMS